METSNSTQPVLEPIVKTAAKKELPIKMSPPFIIALIIFGVLILANVFLLFRKPNQSNFNEVPSPSSLLPSSLPTIRQTSEYSRTFKFIEFERKLLDLQSANQNVDLNENSLGFPVLEMHIDFEK